jgi:hypothetical protein
MMFSLPAFLAASVAHGGWHTVLTIAAYAFAIPALLMSYYAAARYVPEARRALRDGRAARMAHTEGVT